MVRKPDHCRDDVMPLGYHGIKYNPMCLCNVADDHLICQLDKSVVNENSLHVLKTKHRTGIPPNAHLLAVRQVSIHVSLLSSQTGSVTFSWSV